MVVHQSCIWIFANVRSAFSCQICVFLLWLILLHSVGNVQSIDSIVTKSSAFVPGPQPYFAVVPLNPPQTGFNVFQFDAGDQNVEYRLINTEPPGMFLVESASGIVRTTESRYEPGRNYRVFVQIRAKATRNSSLKDGEIAVLHVLAGNRAPQFLRNSYFVDIPENTDVQASVVGVKARAFKSIDGSKKQSILYNLFSIENDEHMRRESDAFSINSRSGVIHLRKKLDYDDRQQPRQYRLKVVASEGNLESEVPLEIQIRDVNDNPPQFSSPLFGATATVKEDVAIGITIVQVEATDDDSGENARIVYSVDDDHFSIDNLGRVSARKRLDADQRHQGYHIYRFNVTARDNGRIPLAATASVHIRTENVNDQAPEFIPTRQYTAYVAEDAQGGTPIVTVQAVDPDRDQVFYWFLGVDGRQSTDSELFRIDKDTGLIQLRDGVRSQDLSQNGQHLYNLTVQAEDDASCCGPSEDSVVHKHAATATVLIGISDVNNNKPEFHHCRTYSSQARIEEGVHKNGSIIIRVVATDDDSPPNGEIVYSLYYPKGELRKPFFIDDRTGDLRPSPYVLFDREARSVEDVTVKATDKGDRPLIGFCQFKVSIVDVNDNAPQFDRGSYETSISRTLAMGHSVLTVFADDRDTPSNARITYALKPDDSAGMQFADDPDHFDLLKQDSGEITLVRSIPPQKEAFKFLVVATDNGFPITLTSQVSVVISLHKSHQSAPKWQHTSSCPSQTELIENIQINSLIFRCRAVSGGDSKNPISYSMANGVKRSTNAFGDFREFMDKRKDGRDWVLVRNMHNLDFEKTRNYTLTLTATDMISGVTADRHLKVLLLDANDQVPRFTVDRFTGTVREELAPNQWIPVVVIQAIDGDSSGPKSRVSYRLLDGPARHLFRIDESSGAITPTARFDRERNDSFVLDVEARDGVQSDLPSTNGPNRDFVKVQIIVGDINDNAPYFNGTGYLGRVAEDAHIGQDVMTVKAHDADRDSNLKYELFPRAGRHSGRIEFGVRTDSGTIFVKEPLDFESRREYSLALLVTDGRHNTTTDISVTVTDVNDNAPRFEQSLYRTIINEEDDDVPKTLFVVKAIDLDHDSQSSDIVYRLEGQGVGRFFGVDERTGQIRALRPLDRDRPDGASKWMFVVQAVDDGGRGLVGYADVQVDLRDINDNVPFFSRHMTGEIYENRDPGREGAFVMTVSASDYDDPLTPNAQLDYKIIINKELDGRPVFSIDRKSGKIFAKKQFDRENPSQRRFVIQVGASDGGVPMLHGAGNVTISVLDVNDNSPMFDPKHHTGSVAETVSIGTAVLSVSAQDPDTEAVDNVLHYELVDNGTPGLKWFYLTSDPDSSRSYVGVLRVKKRLDYEDPEQQQGFDLVVRVFDGKHQSTCTIHVDVENRNDSPPRIHGPRIVRLEEDASIHQTVATFNSDDLDDLDNSATFRIARESDPKRQFSISQDGVLRVAEKLDREDISHYQLIIEAFDAAGNVGAHRIEIYLLDINDNAPSLRTVPSPCIFMENTDPDRQPSCTVVGVDPDTRKNGPPFSMQVGLDFAHSEYFRLEFDPDGDGGNGSMSIKPLRRFDREDSQLGKEPRIPIVVHDNGEPRMEAIRHVRVIIGDENDNEMSDGELHIQVYSYKGELERTAIGRVFVRDKDDWDLQDKTFQWASTLPGFDLNQASGQITMAARKPPGVYRLTATVIDHRRGETAIGSIVVQVDQVPKIAFDSHASVRILAGPNGISKEQFIRPAVITGSSRLQLMAAKVSDYLNGAKVDIFSVMDGMAELQNGHLPVLDVRFSAHGSAFLDPVLLHGLLSRHRAQFEKQLDVKIVAISVDMCKFTHCDSGCQTVTNPSTTAVVINANDTVLVGVRTSARDRCVCPVYRPPAECQSDSCLNQGVCHNTRPGFLYQYQFLPGPRCQGRTRSFSGSGFAWYRPIPACTSLNISLQFMTKQSSALLFYNGPMSSSSQLSYRDYVLIQLVNGKIQAMLNLNGHKTESHLEVNQPALNDGKWHSILLIQNGQRLELILDDCRHLPVDTEEITADLLTTCRMEKWTNDDDERLNIIDPVQLGGIARSDTNQYPDAIKHVGGLEGCVRNLIVNNELYDLASPAYSESSTEGCLHWGSACDSKALAKSKSFCIHGDCFADIGGTPTCICDPGYGGVRCQKKIDWVQFGRESFIKYLMNIPLRSSTTKIEVLFVTGSQLSGQLGLGTNRDLRKYIGTSVEGHHASAAFNLDPDTNQQQQLLLNRIELHTNSSYWLQFDRNPTSTSLTIDGLHRIDRLLDPEKSKFAMEYNEQLMLGAEIASSTKDFNGCVGDFRWDEQQLPLEQKYEDERVAPIKEQRGVVPGCTLRRTCSQMGADFCLYDLICLDTWKGPLCTCSLGSTTTLAEDGTLIGCGSSLAVFSLGISSNAVMLIFVCLLVLIMLVLLMAVYTRRQTPPFERIRPDELSRENIRPYGVEGGGEADNDTYNIAGLRKPVMPPELNGHANGLKSTAPTDGGLKALIKDLETDANATAPYDELRVYDDEGDGISIVSLSSVSSTGTNSSQMDQQLGRWGPRFEKLADMYGVKQ